MKIAHLVKKREISGVETVDVFLKDGFATLKMTVVTTRMRVKKPAMEDTENVQNLNSDAKMTSVSLAVGNVTMMMIVVMDLMKILAKIIHAQMTNSNATLDIVSRKN